MLILCLVYLHYALRYALLFFMLIYFLFILCFFWYYAFCSMLYYSLRYVARYKAVLNLARKKEKKTLCYASFRYAIFRGATLYYTLCFSYYFAFFSLFFGALYSAALNKKLRYATLRSIKRSAMYSLFLRYATLYSAPLLLVIYYLYFSVFNTLFI